MGDEKEETPSVLRWGCWLGPGEDMNLAQGQSWPGVPAVTFPTGAENPKRPAVVFLPGVTSFPEAPAKPLNVFTPYVM